MLGIHDCSDENSQKKRMIDCGFSYSEAYNLNDIYYKKLDKTERSRIEMLEIFDEFEEWEML